MTITKAELNLLLEMILRQSIQIWEDSNKGRWDVLAKTFYTALRKVPEEEESVVELYKRSQQCLDFFQEHQMDLNPTLEIVKAIERNRHLSIERSYTSKFRIILKKPKLCTNPREFKSSLFSYRLPNGCAIGVRRHVGHAKKSAGSRPPLLSEDPNRM